MYTIVCTLPVLHKTTTSSKILGCPLNSSYVVVYLATSPSIDMHTINDAIIIDA